MIRIINLPVLVNLSFIHTTLVQFIRVSSFVVPAAFVGVGCSAAPLLPSVRGAHVSSSHHPQPEPVPTASSCRQQRRFPPSGQRRHRCCAQRDERAHLPRQRHRVDLPGLGTLIRPPTSHRCSRASSQRTFPRGFGRGRKHAAAGCSAAREPHTRRQGLLPQTVLPCCQKVRAFGTVVLCLPVVA